jgi:hypothetical protein
VIEEHFYLDWWKYMWACTLNERMKGVQLGALAWCCYLGGEFGRFLGL